MKKNLTSLNNNTLEKLVYFGLKEIQVFSYHRISQIIYLIATKLLFLKMEDNYVAERLLTSKKQCSFYRLCSDAYLSDNTSFIYIETQTVYFWSLSNKLIKPELPLRRVFRSQRSGGCKMRRILCYDMCAVVMEFTESNIGTHLKPIEDNP